MSTIARTMFAPGPATIATRRLHVAAFQYASGPSASLSSVRPFSAERQRVGRDLLLAERLLELVDRRKRLVRVGRAERRAGCGRTAPASAGASETARDRAPLRVVRDRAVHPGDGHEAAERDRPDPVLDVVPRPLHDRRREADVEAARAQPDRERGEEVAGTRG